MTQRRPRLSDFEARSVQLIAACTLGLAGMASVPPAHASRSTGHSTSLTSLTSSTATADTNRQARVHPAPGVLLKDGKIRT